MKRGSRLDGAGEEDRRLELRLPAKVAEAGSSLADQCESSLSLFQEQGGATRVSGFYCSVLGFFYEGGVVSFTL